MLSMSASELAPCFALCPVLPRALFSQHGKACKATNPNTKLRVLRICSLDIVMYNEIRMIHLTLKSNRAS